MICSPDGRKVKNKAQLARILGNKFDLAGFDFRTGRMTGGVHRRTSILLSFLYHFRHLVEIFWSLYNANVPK